MIEDPRRRRRALLAAAAAYLFCGLLLGITAWHFRRRDVR